MERLMMLRLAARGCAAEAHLNGFCVARLGPQGGLVSLPVHEYTVPGRNRLAFVAGAMLPGSGEAPPPQPLVSRGDLAVKLSLVLCHSGQSPEDPNARVLSQLSWAPGVNEQHEWPFNFGQDVELPVNFPRWRWLDAPQVAMGPALDRQVLELLQNLALEFQRGDAENFLQLARLRTEELALAYQRTPSVWAQGIRDHLQELFDAQALATVKPPEPDSFVLRPMAQGRLVEPLMPDGSPVLKTAPGPDPLKSQVAWPLRLAQVEGKLYILR
jgi:hypothetical protein